MRSSSGDGKAPQLAIDLAEECVDLIDEGRVLVGDEVAAALGSDREQVRTALEELLNDARDIPT